VTIRVLLVEDDRRVHDVVGRLLESIGDLRPVSTVTTRRRPISGWRKPSRLDLAVIDLILDAGLEWVFCPNAAPGRPGKSGGAEQLPVAGHREALPGAPEPMRCSQGLSMGALIQFCSALA
jgi:hypothetical protein